MAVDLFAAAGSECSCVPCCAPVVLVDAADFDVIAAGRELLRFVSGTKLKGFDFILHDFLTYLFCAGGLWLPKPALGYVPSYGFTGVGIEPLRNAPSPL